MIRLDLYVAQHFLKTRSQAQDLIKQNLVSVNGKIVNKTSYQITDQMVEIIHDMPYVSRGGMKLLEAIQSFQLDLSGLIMADIGASTGGFTDCALKHGIKQVYTYDVGTDQLHPSIKNHPNVIAHEQTNILDVALDKKINFITIDVSFTSVKPMLSHLHNEALYVVLVKPQFEVGPKYIKSGIVKDPKKQKEALDGIINHAETLGFKVLNHKPTSLLGKMGNQKYMLLLKK